MWEWIKRRDSRTHRGPVAEAPDPKPVGKVSRKYAPLFTYLENRYANVVVLTFSQIEDLLGFALPDLARTKPEWWTVAGVSLDLPLFSDAWMLAGRTASPNLAAKTVHFERTVPPRHTSV
jgi:hypothetical protein